MNSGAINNEYNAGIHRIAHKMATATGKTPVMAMLILWQAANHRNAGSDDDRFVRRFLILTPGLTVRDRLQDSLDPSNEGNDWIYFKLIPPGEPMGKSFELGERQYCQLPSAGAETGRRTSERQGKTVDRWWFTAYDGSGDRSQN